MAITYTPEQQQVIELHNRNILVSAAAGSGKTAVLVERIVQMICDESHPVDIDRLLVVTFTNAAAAEMRERISQAVAGRLEEHPESAHLQRQATLIHNAQITTIDSFCLFLIRNNFNDIGLDPSFRVADEGELKLLKQDVLAAMLEEHFGDQDEASRADFLHCVECYAANGREKLLEGHILNLYEFAMSFPWPDDWLSQRMEDYRITDKKELMQSPWMQFALEHIRALGEDIVQQYEQAIRLAQQPDGPYMYGKLLDKEKEAAERAFRRESFEELGTALAGIVFDRLPSKKDDSVASDKRELAKNLRSRAKETIGGILKKYFTTPPELVVEQGLYSRRALNQLLSLCREFMTRLEEKKREKNVLDFSDMEHLALNILLKKDENGIHATRTAQEYRSYFTEVMIDEYQDSNLVQEYLLQAVSGEDEGHYNRFMVGDVKQSIYKFRLARPELFMEKYHTYSLTDSVHQRIDLHKNFRSRREVLDSVNYVFSQIMGERLGGISYDDAAALYPGADFPENSGCQTELWLMEKPEDAAMSVKELEAYGITQGILQCVKSYQVTDKVTGALRPCRFGDIVVLLRTGSGWDEVFKEVFAAQGVPAHMTARTGYFNTTEIQTVMQLLRVLDNPLQDIPLFGAMKSIFGGFTEEEIVMIRLCRRRAKLYEALCTYAWDSDAGGEPELRTKAADFLEKIKFYRDKSVYLPVRNLLQEIFTDYGYLNYVTALPAGEQRRANVEMLLGKAADFEKTSYYGLFHFIRYMEQMEKYDVDYGEANTLDENADVVRIMSIHKSKGLEFPVTFVAGLSKRFNMQDTAKALIMDVDMGIGTDYVDPKRRITNKTLRKQVIADKIRLDNLAEELRVLYVAMTRAREKLILTGVLEDVKKKLSGLLYLREQKERELSYGMLTSAASYLDYLLPAFIRHPGFSEVLEQLELSADEARINVSGVNGGDEFRARLIPFEDMQEAEMSGLIEMAGREKKLSALKNARSYQEEKILKTIEERFAFRYPHENLKQLYTKTTVSELKLAALEEKGELSAHLFEEERIVPYIPSFMRGRETEKISGTTRGSAFHRVMELLELPAILENWEGLTDEERQSRLVDALQELVREGRLTEEYYGAVSRDKILRFLSTKLAKRMGEAALRGQLYREQPFVYGIEASRLNQEFPADEKVLIQGIVDVFFIEENGLVLADYKTDVIATKEALMERYRVQLDYYAEALQKMWHMPVKEQILYSFYLEKEVLKR